MSTQTELLKLKHEIEMTILRIKEENPLNQYSYSRGKYLDELLAELERIAGTITFLMEPQ